MRRQDGVDRPPGELAVADLAAARPAHAPGLTDRERRKVVVQQERLLVRPVQRVDPLLVLTGAERGDHQRLRLAAGEQRRAVGARQYAHLGNDGAHGLHVAPVDALAGIENAPAHNLGFDLFERAAQALLVVGRALDTFREIVRHDLDLGGIERLVALLLVGDGIGRAHVILDQAEHLFLERGIVRRIVIARLLRSLLGKPDDGVDHRLEVAVAEHHGAEHHLLVELLRLRLDHQHGVGGTGDDEVELALGHLFQHRVEHVFVVEEADACGPDRTHEGYTRQRQRRGGGDQRQDVGIILQIVRQGRHDHLGFVAPATREQRPDRAIDQPRDQRLFLGRAAFALEVAPRDAARGVELLLVVDGEREKVDAFPWLVGGDHGRQHFALAIGGDDGPVGLPRYLAGFEDEWRPPQSRATRWMSNIAIFSHGS